MAQATSVLPAHHSEPRSVPAAGQSQATPAERVMTGPERAAALMLAIGNQYWAKIWAQLDDDELRLLGAAMSTLGTVPSTTIEALMVEFVTRLSGSGAVMGNFDATERLLKQFLATDRVAGIMDEIRGPAGRNMWEKLSHVQEDVLANYLKNEYPQTIAVVLSKLSTAHAARVLEILPEEIAIDVVTRMLKMDPVQKDVMDRLEQTLRTEFISSLSRTRRRDAHEVMAEIFNSFDRQTEARFLASLEDRDKPAADHIKKLMFTFEDLAKLDSGAIQTLMRQVEKDRLALALKGANENVRRIFFSNMSQRAAKMLNEEMEALGPVRLRDVDEAQSALVNLAKDMAGKGEILIAKNGGDEELVY
jgi:flagellar motor switch protein FliG